jgi:hypothetical protein
VFIILLPLLVLLQDVTSRITNFVVFCEGGGGEWFVKGNGEVAVNAMLVV